jgi:hypothetical protein
MLSFYFKAQIEQVIKSSSDKNSAPDYLVSNLEQVR